MAECKEQINEQDMMKYLYSISSAAPADFTTQKTFCAETSRLRMEEKKGNVFPATAQRPHDETELSTAWQRMSFKKLSSNRDQASSEMLAYRIKSNDLLRRRRRDGNSWLRTGFIIFTIVISLLILLYNFRRTDDSSSDVNAHVTTIRDMVPTNLHKFLTPRLQKSTLNISDIELNIARYNLEQTVYNEDLFGPLQNDSVVIVIQIHNRITYLRHLIVSLAQASGISQALLVFSHDHYDEEINYLVQSVDFCKTMQIFYPYSIQTHPHEFPGEDPNDCPRDIGREQASITKCNNALHPDRHGRYREAKFTQTKHHWWWKANRVFDQLEITKNHSGLVVFLEEDHYVAEDFIYVLNLMEWTCRESRTQCNIFSLNTNRKLFHQDPYYGWYNGGTNMFEMTHWISSKHNTGLTFNRSTWMDIVRCSDYFCKYDDYNWDWSFQHTLKHCLKDQFIALVMRGPRVYHIGECGVHHKVGNCESTALIFEVLKVLKTVKRLLYPDHLTLTYPMVVGIKFKLSAGNGGWGDLRDHELCMNMTV